MRTRTLAGITAFATMILGPHVSRANTYIFTTAPSDVIHDPTVTGGPAIPVDASVTFITALDQITIRITNLQQETAGSVIQTISAVDFHMQGLTATSLSPTLFSW